MKRVILFLKVAISLFVVIRNEVVAQPRLSIVNIDSFNQKSDVIRYQIENGIELSTIRSQKGDSLLMVVTNYSKSSVCHLNTAANPRSHEFWSLGGLSDFSWSRDSVMRLHIISTAKSDTFKIDLAKSNVFKIYLTLYIISDSILKQLKEHSLCEMKLSGVRPYIALRAGLIDSLEGIENVYRLVKMAPVCREVDCGQLMVFSTAKYHNADYTVSSLFQQGGGIGLKRPKAKNVLFDSARIARENNGILYIDKHKRYTIQVRNDGTNNSRAKMFIRNTSKSAMGIIPPKSLIANEYCEWTVGSYLILSGCYDALVIQKMLYLAPGEEIDYVVNLGNCSLYSFYIDLCVDVDRIASDESGNKPTLELKDGRNYVEVPYSNDILETPGLFHSISIRNIVRDLVKGRPVVTVRGYQ